MFALKIKILLRLFSLILLFLFLGLFSSNFLDNKASAAITCRNYTATVIDSDMCAGQYSMGCYSSCPDRCGNHEDFSCASSDAGCFFSNLISQTPYNGWMCKRVVDCDNDPCGPEFGPDWEGSYRRCSGGTWNCASTACSSSSSSSTDSYCTYLSNVSCGGSTGSCRYGYSSKRDSRCGSTCAIEQSTVTVTAGCSSGRPTIRATWNDVTQADYYDIQRRYFSSGAWTSYTPSPPDTLNDNGSSSFSKTYTVGRENTLYQVRVRTHTNPGYAGPTTWESDTVTTLNCSTPPPPTNTPTPTPTGTPTFTCNQCDYNNVCSTYTSTSSCATDCSACDGSDLCQ